MPYTVCVAHRVVSLMMVLSGTFFMLPSIQTKAWTATALNLVSILLGVVLYVGIKGVFAKCPVPWHQNHADKVIFFSCAVQLQGGTVCL